MQSTPLQKMPKIVLHQEDISGIIKHFSFTIQQRFEEIQKNCNYFTCLNSINYERTDLQKDILHRYNEYKTSDEHEIKLLEKFVERLIQIFQFFKSKTEEPEILHAMGEKISEKLRQILKNQINCHFFVNNRPKTHSTNVKPFGNRSASNDFLSIIGPGCKQEIDLTAVFINNGKKVRTESTQQKRTVEVGKLFKYVFSILKRGFLIKLRMEKPEKKIKQQCPKDLSCIEEANTISVEGTCAILRNCSEKSNKQASVEAQEMRMINPSKQKNHTNLGFQNKKQFYISQKVKNRSVSTNQYSILSKQNPSILKQSTSKLRDLDRKVEVLYEIMNIEKYSVVRVAKDPQIGKRDQVKRNLWIEGQIRKYESSFYRRVSKCINLDGEILTKIILQTNQNLLEKNKDFFITPDNEEANSSFQCDKKMYSKQNRDQIIESSCKKIQIDETHENDQFLILQNYQRKRVCESLKTQNIEKSSADSVEESIESARHTLIVCSSRNCDQKVKILADKSSNLMDIDRADCRLKDFKSRTDKKDRQDRKSLRLNLPSMLGDKSNLLNQSNIRLNNLTNQQNHQRISEKSQYYLQSYHVDPTDDGLFVPLLPKREKNTENVYEKKHESISIKKKNLIPNFHPLNRCRIFREKKVAKNSIIIPNGDNKISNINESMLSGKIRNSLF